MGHGAAEWFNLVVGKAAELELAERLHCCLVSHHHHSCHPPSLRLKGGHPLRFRLMGNLRRLCQSPF